MKITLYQEMKTLMEQIISTRYTNVDNELEYCLNLLEIASRENDTYSIAFAHTYLGDAYIAQNDMKNCGYHLIKALILCEENDYFDLLLSVHNLLGIYYETISDEQTAIQYYLKALQLGSKCHDTSIECIVLNNIASNFGMLGEYEEAKKYYMQALTSLEKNSSILPNSEYIRLRIWSNISAICYHLGELEEMHSHLLLCEKIDDSLSIIRDFILCRGWCAYFAKRKNRKKAIDKAQELLSYYYSLKCQDKYLIYEVMVDVCEIMIDLKSAEYFKKLLAIILQMRNDGETNRSNQIQKLNTQYCETFGTKEELACAYYEYYKLTVNFEKNINISKINGLKNILYLDNLKNTLVLEKETLDVEAHLDELTKLYNRRYFNKLISKTALSAATTQLGFIMIDIDYFKEYNDNYGHSDGDTALESVAQLLKQNATKDIIPSRYGGDEFVCLCVNINDAEIINYISAVQKSLSDLAIEHKKSHCSSILTLSIGFSCHNWTIGQTPDNILDEADHALYSSKVNGRNTYSNWTEIKHQ